MLKWSIFLCLTLLLSCTSSPERVSKTRTQKTTSLTSFYSMQRTVPWSALPGWQEDNFIELWPAWLKSCQVLSKAKHFHGVDWRAVCRAATRVDKKSNAAIRYYFETHMLALEVRSRETQQNKGVITGYYEPYLNGSFIKTRRYQIPLHRYPNTWKVSPSKKYPTRSQLLANGKLSGHELLWVDDPISAAFLHIQGSGRIRLSDNNVIRVGFAGSNNHPFRSFAQRLLKQKEISAEHATRRGIQNWAAKNHHRVHDILNTNPRYIFFKELPALQDEEGPLGALGVSLTPRRSIAIDPKHLPLGAPIYLSTHHPLSKKPLQNLVIAQDTGSAIIGAPRADFYWGTGNEAEFHAERMKHQGKMWLLLPRYR